jgi:hypothetical protein
MIRRLEYPRWAGEPVDLHACVQALFIKAARATIKDLEDEITRRLRSRDIISCGEC